MSALPQFLRLSGNLVARTFFVQLPFFVGSVVAAGINPATLALHAVLMQLFFVMTYSLDGFAHTAEALTGYTFGAKQPHQLNLATRYCSAWGVGYALLIGAYFLFWGEPTVAWLSAAPDVRTLSGSYLPWLAVAPLLCVGAFVFDGVFIGTTHITQMRNAMVAAVVVWGMLLWLTAELRYHSVWIAMSGFMTARTLLLALYYPQVLASAQPENAQ